MEIIEIRPGYYRLTCPGGLVMDKRTGRIYSAVVCSERNIKHFEPVAN